MAEADLSNARCPRCGSAFHCGAREAACACGQVRLDEATRADLRRHFEGCLCTVCLRALQAERDADCAGRATGMP